MKSSWTVLLFIFCLTSLAAQNLDRQPDLGIDYGNESDGKGVRVISVYADHFGAQMGLKEGDIIIECGGIKVPHMGALMYWINRKKVGESILLTVKRGSKTNYLTGKITSKPFEQGSSVYYGSFKFKGGKIRTIINKPENVSKAPAILFIPDYTCHSTDFAGRSYHSTYKLARQFAELGYVFIRVEKLGIGDSQTRRQCYESGYFEEGEVYQAGFKYVQKLDYVDNEKIHILAHGFGGNQVLNIIQKDHPATILFWGYYNNFTNEACLPLRNASYWEEVKVSKQLKNWRKIKSRVIFYHPEYDIFDNEGRDARQLNEYLISEGKESEYKVFPRSNHAFLSISATEHSEVYRESYPNPPIFEQFFNSEIVPAFIEWIEAY